MARSRAREFIVVAAALAFAAAAAAQSPAPPAAPFRVALPIDCRVGETCWLVNYVDTDPGPGASDYACGKATYDGHKGTDIAIRDLAAMRAGVPVRAAAAGVVARVRDGMDDASFEDLGGPQAVRERECGNGVFVRHDGGWTTQYCHMRKGSIAVKPGERVALGQTLGLVGESGLAEFPHVHLQVARAGKIVDPFAGEEGTGSCGPGPKPLWTDEALAAMPYRPTAIYAAGFADSTPSATAARTGDHAHAVLPRDAAALVLWADIFWVRPGDSLSLAIIAPDGATLVRQDLAADKDLARRFVFAGRRRSGDAWRPGVYRGEIALRREKGEQGAEDYRAVREVRVE